MENLFESLAQNVSEECFDDIISMVEELLSEDVYSAIQKYAPENKKQALMNKAYDNKGAELYAAGQRERKPEENVSQAVNRVAEKRNPKNKQADNIISKGVAKLVASDILKDEIKDENSGTKYASSAKEKLANKLNKQGGKEFKQGADQYQATHVPVKVTYKDGQRVVSIRPKNKYD